MQIPLMKTFQSKVIKMIDYTLEDWDGNTDGDKGLPYTLPNILGGRSATDGYKEGWKYNSLGIKVAGTIKEN